MSKVTILSKISTASQTDAIKAAKKEVMSAGADSSKPPAPDNLILERIPVALSNQSKCDIDSKNDNTGTDVDNPLMVCNESSILENFINFDIIKDDLIDIVSMVCDRILYGGWDNCFFDWYDSNSDQHSYRFPQMTNFKQQEDGALLQELIEGSGTDDTQFQIDYLTKFRNRLKQLISLNTPELNEIIRLHTISLTNETKDNNLEFYRKIIDDSEQHTYNGTLETFRILNRNMFEKYKKSKINNPCVENSRKKELNEMRVSLAWRTLFYLKKTILYLYTFCITIIKNNYLLDINPDDYKQGSKKYIVDIEGITKSLPTNDDTTEENPPLFYIQRTPMLDINHISRQIFNLRKDFGLFKYSNNPDDYLNINTHLLHTEYISMLYQALCKDITEDNARDDIQQLDNSNDNTGQHLDTHLNEMAEELNTVVDNLALKGGIFSKKILNPRVILNNIKNNFGNLRSSMIDGYKSILKMIDNRNKNEELYHQSSKLLINNYNLENLYNLVDGAIDSILKKNYLTYFTQISSLINFSFDVMGNQLTTRQLIDKFSLDDKSITDKIYPENLGIIEKHILIGCSYRSYTDTQNNYKLMFIRYDILDKIRRIQYNDKQKSEMIKKYLLVKDIPTTLHDSSGSKIENTFFNGVLNIISSYNIQEKQQIREYSNIIGTIMDYALGKDIIYCKLLYSYSFNSLNTSLVTTNDKENIVNYIYQGHSPYFSKPTMDDKTYPQKKPYYLNKIDSINNFENNKIKMDVSTHIGRTIKYNVDNNDKIPKDTLGNIIGIVDNSEAPYLVKFANDAKNIMKLTSAKFYPENKPLSLPSNIDNSSISKWVQDSNGYLPIYYTHKVGYYITKNAQTTLELNYPIDDSLKKTNSSWSKVFINNNKSYYWTYLSKNNSRISSGDIFYSFYHPTHCIDGKCNGKDLPLEELNKIIRYPELQIYMLTPKGIHYFIKEGIPTQNNWKTGKKGITQITMLNIKEQKQTITPYFSKLSIQPKLDETLVNQYYYLDSDTFLKHIKKNFKYIIKQVNKPENKELIDKITTTTQSGRWWETPNNISTLPIGGRMSKKSKSFYSLSSNKSKKNTHNYNLQGGSNILPYLAIILSGFKQTHFILNKDKLEYQVRDDEINLYTKTKINDIHIPISPSNISIVDIYSKKLEEIINNDISLNIVQLLSNKENNIIKGGLVNEVCSNIETCEYVKLFQTLYQKIKIARGKKKVYDEIVSKLINGDMTTPLPNITIDNAEKLFCMLNISINEKINCSNLSGGNKTKKKRKTKKKNKSY